MRPLLAVLCLAGVVENVPPARAQTPEPPPAEKPAEDPLADPKVAAIARALETGYGKLFEGIARDERGSLIVKFSGKTFPFDDGKVKTAEQRIDDPDIEDMFAQIYPLTNPTEKVEKDDDPGRARVEDFFKTLYGENEAAVRKNLVTVNFCGNKLPFNARCGAADALVAVGKELDALFEKTPAWKVYAKELGGTFQWRFIAGTKRLSNHSFGTAIDLNVGKSAYWRWDPPSKLTTFSRKDWPSEIIEAFERHGFVWGGKWWHYDTMHFEYRPEIIAFARARARAAAAPGAEPKPKLEAKDLLVPLQQ